MEALGYGLFFLFWIALVGGGIGFWVYCIVEVVKLPEHAYRMAGKEKVTWVLVVALVQWLGGIIWWFAARREVKAAAAAHPYPPAPAYGPPPGWYPDPSGSGRAVWWDGTRWVPPTL